MNLPKRDHTNTKLLAGSLFGALVTAFLLYNDRILIKMFVRRDANAVQIGKIVNYDGDVRRRMSQSLTWLDAQSGEELFERDSLFTGSESKTDILMDRYGQISIDSDSLIVLRSKNDEVLFDLQIGTFSSSPQKAQKLKVLHQGQILEVEADMKSAPVKISRTQGGKIRVSSRTGDVKLKVNGASKIVPKNQGVDIAQDLSLAAIGPKMFDRLDDAPKAESQPEPTIQPTKVEEPPVVLTPEPTPEPVVEAPTPEDPKDLLFDTMVAPKILDPKKMVVLEFERDGENGGRGVATDEVEKWKIKNPPTMAWGSVPGGVKYVVEIANGTSFLRAQKINVNKNLAFKLPKYGFGKKLWRVRAQSGNGKLSIPSLAGEITIKAGTPKLNVPPPVSESTTDPSLLKVPKSFRVSWVAIPGATSYKVKAGDKEGITRGLATEVSLMPNTKMPIQVAAVDRKGNVVSDFAKGELAFDRKVEIQSPDLVLPADKTTVVTFKGMSSTILFKWNRVNKIGKYEFQLSDSPEFTSLIAEKTVTGTNYVFNDSIKSPKVYWRVRAVSGEGVSSWTPARAIDFQSTK
jgi:hypothetical protein